MPTTTTTTTTTTKLEHVYGSPHYRFNAWVALMMLSLVALVSICAATDHKQQRNFEERWSIAMAAISMILGFFASVGHAVYAMRERFVSSLVELVMAIICVGCWIFSLPMITTPDDGLAVDHNFKIDNANLYFASWGAFIFAMILMAGVSNERGVAASRDGVAKRWLWIMVSSLIVMAASSRLFDRACQGRQQLHFEYCKELKLGISLGVISAFLAGFMVLCMWFIPDQPMLGWVGAFFAVIMIIIWAVLIAYLTFDGGPASFVGNLFFGIWVSAIIALDLGVCYFLGWLRLE